MKGILKLGVVTVLLILLPALMGVAQGKYKEAPMLARLVAAGKLPPVDQRLPDNPVVAGPGVLNGAQYVDWTAGKYQDGRSLRTAALDSKVSLMDISVSNFLWAPDQTSKNLIPVLVQSFTTSPDYKVFNFTLRKGLKWSNGDPVTTDDVRFTFQDLYQYPDAGIAYPANLHSQGDLKLPIAKLAITDQYSFTLTFDRSYGYFLADLRSWITDSNILIRPSKFLKQYHPKYTAVATLNKMAKDAGLPDWKALLQIKAGTHWDRSRNPLQIGVPTLQPWIPVQITDTHVRVERNPYYYWVDTQGQQLPYIDAVDSDIIKDKDAMLVKIVSGTIDYIIDDFARLPYMPIFQLGADKAGYHVVLAGGFNSPPLLFINQDFEWNKAGSQWQKLVQDPQHRFGKAVMLAIDHNDVNNTLYFGKYGMDDLVTGASFDPAQSNSLLDELGMKKGADGFRTYPNGTPFQVTITSNGLSPDQIDMTTLLSKYLNAVGLNATPKTLAGNIFDQKVANNEFQMTVMWNDGGGWPSGISMDYWPAWKGGWAPASAQYVDTQGKQGRANPPQFIKDFFTLFTQRKAVPPQSPEGEVLYEKLLKWFGENYVMIWPVGRITQPMIFSNKLRNIPKDNYVDVFGATEAAVQWYFDQP